MIVTIGTFIAGALLGLGVGFSVAVRKLMAARAVQEEAEIGKVARDEDCELWLYFDEPEKIVHSGVWRTNGNCVKVYPERFRSVKWEDEEPTKVKIVKCEEAGR